MIKFMIYMCAVMIGTAIGFLVRPYIDKMVEKVNKLLCSKV